MNIISAAESAMNFMKNFILGNCEMILWKMSMLILKDCEYLSANCPDITIMVDWA